MDLSFEGTLNNVIVEYCDGSLAEERRLKQKRLITSNHRVDLESAFKQFRCRQGPCGKPLAMRLQISTKADETSSQHHLPLGP